ncbi:hypothetical protein BGX34_007151, partial [Mortierella sp. NVP85]
MKFTSVILALSAVVAMVQAAPIPDLPVIVAGDTRPGLPVEHPNAGIPLAKRVSLGLNVDNDDPSATNTGIITKRALTESIPADISIIQNTIHIAADQVQINLESLVTAEVNAHIQAHLHVANIVSVDAEVL